MRSITGLLQYALWIIALGLVLKYGTKTTMIINSFFNGGVKAARTLQLR